MANSLRGPQRRCGVLWPASVNVRHRLRRVQLGKQFEGIGCRYILQFPISRGNAPCSVPPRRAPQKLGKGLGSRVQVDGARPPVALPGASAPPRINGGVQELAETFDAQSTAELDMYGDYGVKAAQKNRAVYEVLRIDPNGKVRTIYVKRRDLLRTYGLQPRDLRRIDPAWDNTQSSQTMVVKDQVLLINMGGVRLVVASEKALLFEAEKVPSVKFLDIVLPHLQSRASSQFLRLKTMESREQPLNAASNLVGPTQPFEQEILEGALIMATGILDAELVALMKRVRVMLGKLPQEINPVNLEELRRIKQSCVELESKAATLAEVLEEILDDEEKIADINLSSRPLREARQRRRERNRLRREQNVGMGVAGDSSYQSAQDALEEMEDEEQEERDIEETEDMLEYYLQRTSTTQSEAERVLAGARDLEESIGVSLSARRFEVNRLELMLSMGSFAAALGAMIAGIFGMNLRNTMEMSALSFYGITAAIVLGCVYVFFAIFLHTKRRRIV